MENANFWSEFFDTYQSLPDWLKFFWLVIPPLFVFAFTALTMLQFLALKRVKHQLTGNLIYSISRDDFDMFHVYLHCPEEKLPGQGTDIDTEATIDLLERLAARDRKSRGKEKNNGG